jgi:hypothetical protein
MVFKPTLLVGSEFSLVILGLYKEWQPRDAMDARPRIFLLIYRQCLRRIGEEILFILTIKCLEEPIVQELRYRRLASGQKLMCSIVYHQSPPLATSVDQSCSKKTTERGVILDFTE